MRNALEAFSTATTASTSYGVREGPWGRGEVFGSPSRRLIRASIEDQWQPAATRGGERGGAPNLGGCGVDEGVAEERGACPRDGGHGTVYKWFLQDKATRREEMGRRSDGSNDASEQPGGG